MYSVIAPPTHSAAALDPTTVLVIPTDPPLGRDLPGRLRSAVTDPAGSTSRRNTPLLGSSSFEVPISIGASYDPTQTKAGLAPRRTTCRCVMSGSGRLALSIPTDHNGVRSGSEAARAGRRH